MRHGVTHPGKRRQLLNAGLDFQGLGANQMG